jgi:hypothetical protein
MDVPVAFGAQHYLEIGNSTDGGGCELYVKLTTVQYYIRMEPDGHNRHDNQKQNLTDSN